MACFFVTEIPLMCQQIAEFHECFDSVEDPRMTAKCTHPLHAALDFVFRHCRSHRGY